MTTKQAKILETILASVVLAGMLFLGMILLDIGLQRQEKASAVCGTDTECLDYAIRNGWDEEDYP